jgi:HEAT repeat protein
METAVTSKDPAVRRDAVIRVAKGRHAADDWAISGYEALALLDEDAHVRCVALRALARTRAPRATDSALKILNHEDYPPGEVRPPDALTRADAVLALADLSAAGAVTAQQRPAVVSTLLERLRADKDKQARAFAARGLGAFPQEDVVAALIAGVSDPDFVVVHACEDALVRLTGVTNRCNASDWEKWFESNRGNLFAGAGSVPESRRPRYTNRLEQAGYEMSEWWDGFFPESKPN